MDPIEERKKKGGRTRTVTFSSKDSDDQYARGVKKLEEAFGTRGGYVLGEGALNKNDALYMMEEDEKKRQAERKRQDEEAARFKQMVAQEKKLKDVEADDGDEGGGKKDVDAELSTLTAKRMTAKKRRKTVKELVRVKKLDNTQADDNDEKQDGKDDLKSLFGAYDDEDDDDDDSD